jgi:hypothetical protein
MTFRSSRVFTCAILAGLLEMSGLLSAQTKGASIYVTVSDDTGQPVSGLSIRDFQVLVTGRDLPVLNVAPAREPLSVVFVIDGLNANQIPQMQSALRSVVRLLRANAPGSRIGFVRDTIDATAAQMSSVESDQALGQQFMAGLPAPEGISVAVAALRREATSRRVVLAITSGPRALRATASQTLAALQQAGAQFWDLEIDETPTEPAVTAAGHAQSERDETTAFLETLAQSSGGRREHLLGTAALDRRMTDVTTLLLSQYVLSVDVPAGSKITAGSVRVEVQRRGTRVLAPQWLHPNGLDHSSS